LGKLNDLTGLTFNRLTVLKMIPERNKSHRVCYLCQCSCKNKTLLIVCGGDLKTGNTKSCGCLKSESTIIFNKKTKTKHGLEGTKIYRTWRGMKSRCYCKSDKDFANYGGRGISVCSEWLDKDNGIIVFYEWSLRNGYEKSLQIDRIDTNGNYSPDNCRWVTSLIQQNNRRDNHWITIGNVTDTITNWSKKSGISRSTILWRIRHGRTETDLIIQSKRKS
jgi:hypothetical protein